MTFKVIAHGYCSPFYRNDILIAHGNMKCYFQTVMNKKPNRLSGSGLLSFYERWAGAFSKISGLFQIRLKVNGMSFTILIHIKSKLFEIL